MTMKRALQHLSFPRWRIGRIFSKDALKAIEAAISASESAHDGELRFVVEGGMDFTSLLRGLTSRQRAITVFSQLRVWDTERNSGVLIYVQLADRKVEIVADRGIHKKAGDEVWQRICAGMEQAFRRGEFERGAVDGVVAVGRVLSEHFPPLGHNPNELPDAVALL